MQPTSRPHRRIGATTTALAVALIAWSAASGTAPASAAHYHVNCVAHGLVHGSSTNDGAAHSRVESGCSGQSFCKMDDPNHPDGAGNPLQLGFQFTNSSTTCNVFVNNYPFGEWSFRSRTSRSGQFGEHSHYPH